LAVHAVADVDGPIDLPLAQRPVPVVIDAHVQPLAARRAVLARRLRRGHDPGRPPLLSRLPMADIDRQADLLAAQQPLPILVVARLDALATRRTVGAGGLGRRGDQRRATILAVADVDRFVDLPLAQRTVAIVIESNVDAVSAGGAV